MPGNIFSSNNLGANRLIKRSEAKLVSHYTDVLEEFNLSVVGEQIEMAALFPEDENQSQILRHVTFEPVHIDDVIRNSELPISTVSSALAMMELKGLVKQVGGMNFMRLRESTVEYEAV